MASNHKITSITSQVSDGSTTPRVFNTLQEAKDWFYTSQAQQCSEDNTYRVEYALVADENGLNTKLKRTEEWQPDGQGQIYNNAKIQLIGEGNWNNNVYTTEQSEDHIF